MVDRGDGEPRIGVYICHCGTNIAGVVDIEEVTKFISSLPYVVVKDYKFMCSDPGQSMIEWDIKEGKISRVVVAACSPSLHEATFRKVLERSGLNRYLFQMANIREQCSWVTEDTREATEKAKAIIRGAVYKAIGLEELIPKAVDINPNVLIVGGGIAGIQAALDIANAGYKVYLVERNSTIGGHMAKFDKTFPTLDCAACILTPKMTAVAQHPNINLMSLSEVEQLSGFVGNFKAKVRRKARYVDIDKCTGCGECAKVCPVNVENEWEEGIAKRTAIYRTFPQAVPGAFVVDKRETPPCKQACPAGVNVQAYVNLVARGRYKEALDVVRDTCPIPGIVGRVCPHPCESRCKRGEVDESVAICSIKRFLSDWERENRILPKEFPVTRREKVAIVGSGPAGLTCAYELRRMGYEVVVFEALLKPGGMLVVGIPENRLPRDLIDWEVEWIKSCGVKIMCGVKVGEDIKLSEIKNEYSAVFIATGAHRGLKMGIPGEELEGVVDAIEFLRDVNIEGVRKKPGDKVVVIGGGNTAIDAARTALRLGCDVNIVYRRSRVEMPANPWEVNEAEAEGVKIHYLAQPVRILGEGGRVVGMECLKCELGEPDASGRRRPVPIPGSEFVVEADCIIPAVSQEPDFGPLQKEFEELGVKIHPRWHSIVVDEVTLQTNVPWIFAGGDVTTGPATVVEAIGAGRRAAKMIDRYLRGEILKTEEKPLNPPRHLTEREKKKIPKIPRQIVPKLSLGERVNNFREVELGLSEEQAQAEARRCLMCGPCCECMECMKVCEPKAINHDDDDKVEEIEVGAIIVATGFKTFDPERVIQYGYGKYPGVITALQFERLNNATGPTEGKIVLPDGREPMSVALIHCVGSRDRNYNEYCSRVCCMYALKYAHLIKEKIPDAQVYHFYIDMRCFGKGYEEFYKRLQDEGVVFIRGRPAEVTDKAITEDEKDKLIVVAEDTLLGKVIRVPVDMVILCVGLEAQEDAEDVARAFNLSCVEGFFIEQHPKLAPVSTTTDGVFIAGCCQSPKDIPDTIAQASAAASQALSLISQERIEIEPIIAEIDEKICSGCKTCISVCMFDAISFDEEKGVSRVNDVVCKGCGTCVSTCPSGAAMARHFTDKQLLLEIEGVLL